MPIELVEKKKISPVYILARLGFYRLISLFLIVFALFYWADAIGISSNTSARFDLMPEHWQLVTTILCVLMPVSALGLWAGSSWGVVVWLLAAITELIMYQGFPDLYGEHDFRVIFHVVCMVIFTTFIILGVFLENKR